MNEKETEQYVEYEIKGSQVVYFDKYHMYYVDGVETLSATQISQLLNPFKLMKIPSHILKKAGEKGTKIHNSIETYLKTGETFDKSDPHYGYFESFLKLWGDHSDKIKINTLEHIAISKKYKTPLVGTIDLYCDYNGKPTIIDWKTSSQLSVPEWRTQLSIYRELVRYTHGVKDVDCYIAWLKKNGEYELLKVEPLKDDYLELLFSLLEYREVISRLNVLKYEIYGEELIK